MKTTNSFSSKLFALTFALMASVTLWAERFEYNQIYYNTLSDSTVEVTYQTEWSFAGYNHTSVVIPPTVEYHGKTYHVIKIGQSAFYEYTSLTSISLPNTITNIGIGAFCGCTNLTKLLLPPSAQITDNGAFAYCTSLTEVTCLSTIPPIRGDSEIYPDCFFHGVDVSKIPLYVPAESIELYKNADHWKDFGQILAVDNFNKSLIGEWHLLNRENVIVSISDSLMYITLGNQLNRYIASANQLYLERLWASEDAPHRWETCNYSLYGDTLVIDNFLPTLLATYPPTFADATLIRVGNSYKSQWCDTWNVLSYGWDPEGGDGIYNAYTIIYQLGEDTLINEVTYQKLMGYVSFASPATQEYVAALRFADDKKVFVYYDNTEYLLYDFGAQVGDTLEIFGGIDYYEDYKTLSHVVTEIDSLEDGRLQMQLVVDIQYRSIPITWIEGIGSKNGIVHNIATDRYGAGTKVLLCAYNNNECLYTTDNPYYTSLGCVYNDPIFTATKEVTLPTQSTKKFIYNGQLLIIRDGKTYNVMGVEVGE